MPLTANFRCRLMGANRLFSPTVSMICFVGMASLANAETLAPSLVSPEKVVAGTTVSAPLSGSPAQPSREPLTLVRPKVELWPELIEANGNIMPWQESHIGTEVGGLRLVSVLVNVGDVVKKGQVLARLNPATVEAELDAANAQMVEAKAALAQAVATLERANRLAPSGGVSQQELTLYETQKHTAEARLNASLAQVKKQKLKLDFATLVAPDDGVISSRSAAEGAIVHAGSELFRLIRQGRLEWRAEVEGKTLLKVSVGQEVTVKSPLGPDVKGRIRQVSPTIDLTTRNGLVYVDLPTEANLKAGLRVSGTLTMGKKRVLVLPSAAVLQQEGVPRVFKVADGKIEAIEVKTGRVIDGWAEVVAGIDEHTQVIGNDLNLLKGIDPAHALESKGPVDQKKNLSLRKIANGS